MLSFSVEGKALRASSAMVPTLISVLTMVFSMGASAQETDLTQTPNTVGAGIYKSLEEQIGAGRGDILTPDSSLFLIARDPFRAIVRGRQLFQRKFTQAQGVGPRTGDGEGDIESDASIGAGLADSCAACHGRPRGSAGSRRRRLHAARQSRCPASVRPRAAGDAGRRDHARPARDP